MSIIANSQQELYLERQIHIKEYNRAWIDTNWVLFIGQASSRASYICGIHIEITEGRTWIGTDLTKFIGTGHLLHIYVYVYKYYYHILCDNLYIN